MKSGGNHVWRVLRSVGYLRSAVYLAVEIRKALLEDRACDRSVFEEIFQSACDPWDYESGRVGKNLFASQVLLLDAVRCGKPFQNAAEIGGAEGHFTELLVDRCKSLQVFEISTTALMRAEARRKWPVHVGFNEFDLRRDSLEGSFDLIVLTGVLEYFSRRKTFFTVREKLLSAIAPGGHLLVGTTRPPRVVDESWWARYLIRGRWINEFIGRHLLLRSVCTVIDEDVIITLFQRV